MRYPVRVIFEPGKGFGFFPPQRWIVEIQKLDFAALAAHAELRRGEGGLRQPPVHCMAVWASSSQKLIEVS
jgi:hypothetical protein